MFHRLNVIRIHIPRMSDRREDIPTLARHFLSRAAQELAEPMAVTDFFIGRIDAASKTGTVQGRFQPGAVRRREPGCLGWRKIGRAHV